MTASWLDCSGPPLLAFCLAIAGGGASASADLEVDLELVIAVDVSGSMDKEEFALQRGGYVAAIRHPNSSAPSFPASISG